LPTASLRGAGRLLQRDVRLGQLLHRAGPARRPPRGAGARHGGQRAVRGAALRRRAQRQPQLLPQPLATAVSLRDDGRAAGRSRQLPQRRRSTCLAGAGLSAGGAQPRSLAAARTPRRRHRPGALFRLRPRPGAGGARRRLLPGRDPLAAGAPVRRSRLPAQGVAAPRRRRGRAIRESGFDVNFHFGPYAGLTHHYAPVGLNSLLYRYERDLHDFAVTLGKTADAGHWSQLAAARKTAMDKYLWQPAQGMYMDYDFVAGKPSADPYLNTFYPLWAGTASPDQAKALRGKLALFEQRGGLAMSTRVTGAQWDAPYGWAPTNWLAIKGLDDYGFHADARRLAGKFMATVDRGYADDGTIREKYNMAQG